MSFLLHSYPDRVEHLQCPDKKILKNTNGPFRLFPFIPRLKTTENADMVSTIRKNIYFKNSFHLLMNNVQIYTLV